MMGRRREDFLSDQPGFRWEDVAPGDYWKTRGDRWHLIAPSGEHGGADARWSVTEHDDGTITISPSLFFNSPHGWHGFLERGIWRSV